MQKFRRLVVGKELGGADHIGDQLQLRQLEVPAHQLVGGSPSVGGLYIHAVLPQRLYILGGCLSALGYAQVREFFLNLLARKRLVIVCVFQKDVPEVQHFQTLRISLTG